ncbi:MAG: HK97 gp10 family phage protein [Clostridia bacterium]|nr:HK97 gp10 family phage protein [Clostridia bacterium]
MLDALDRLSDDEILAAAKPGLKKGLEMIRGDAQANCPVDTGELREKIKTRIHGGNGEMTGEVYSGAPHGIYVEMGTGPKGEASHAGVNPEWAVGVTYRPNGWVYPTKDGGFRFTRGMPARPFLYPAFKANEKKAQEAVAQAVIRHVQGG